MPPTPSSAGATSEMSDAADDSALYSFLLTNGDPQGRDALFIGLVWTGKALQDKELADAIIDRAIRMGGWENLNGMSNPDEIVAALTSPPGDAAAIEPIEINDSARLSFIIENGDPAASGGLFIGRVRDRQVLRNSQEVRAILSRAVTAGQWEAPPITS